MLRPIGGALILLLGMPAQPAFDPMRGSLDRAVPQAVYSDDIADPWNELFFLLFTRSVPARVVAPDARPLSSGDERLALSDRRFTRIEAGDRAIDPLYPSWQWMNSTAFDFSGSRRWRVLEEPQLLRLGTAINTVQRTARSRPPLARALMQADLWAAYEMLAAAAQPSGAGTSSYRPAIPRSREASEMLPRLASAMRALALTGDEIAQLPASYPDAVASSRLPPVLVERSAWIEIRWFAHRMHERAANDRRATRVFVKPRQRPADMQAFLNQFRELHGGDGDQLESVALVTEILLITSDGRVVPSPLTWEVQLRGAAARIAGADVAQFELSRRRLLTSPKTGGLVTVGAADPVYLPMAGNDFSFATPPRLDGEPVVAPLATRCAVCHGSKPGVGHMMTFSKSKAGGPAPPVDRLSPAANLHAREVAARKMASAEFRALMQQWR